MPCRSVDIAIIGAGSAGISALKLVRRHTGNFLLIDGGALGTTCARVGCMPSKALVEIAARYHDARSLHDRGVLAGPLPAVDRVAVMREVRRLRDHFSEHMIAQTRQLSERHFLQGHARFLDATTLDVDGERIAARAVIVATGSRPLLPPGWEALAPRLLQSGQFFELPAVPTELAVVGLGSIGLELGQAAAILGARVSGVDLQRRLGCLSDPTAIRHALAELNRTMDLHLGHHPRLEPAGERLRLSFGDCRLEPEHLLVSSGRGRNLDRLGMDALATGRAIDPGSLQLGELPVFVAGDSGGHQALLHEAIDDGQIAAANALAFPHTRAYRRRVALQITFTQPQLATVGLPYAALDIHRAIIGEAPLATQGRALLGGGSGGVLRLYAEPRAGKLLGAELVAPQAEHLAHGIAAWLEAGLTVEQALRLPFYHPTLEEGLRTALNGLAGKLPGGAARGPRLAPRDGSAGA